MIKIFFGIFVFLLLTGRADAATGFTVGKDCYSTSADALSAFASDYPRIDNGYLYVFNSAPTVNSSGLISFRINYRLLTTLTWTNGANQTVQLATCNAPATASFSTSSIRSDSVSDFVLIVGCCLMMAFGIQAGRT